MPGAATNDTYCFESGNNNTITIALSQEHIQANSRTGGTRATGSTALCGRLFHHLQGLFFVHLLAQHSRHSSYHNAILVDQVLSTSTLHIVSVLHPLEPEISARSCVDITLLGTGIGPAGFLLSYCMSSGVLQVVILCP